jgi:hypothetical protein
MQTKMPQVREFMTPTPHTIAAETPRFEAGFGNFLSGPYLRFAFIKLSAFQG